jgi:hypothetical protein
LQAPVDAHVLAAVIGHAMVQQMFPSQWPSVHWADDVQAAPSASNAPHMPPLQVTPEMQSALVEHDVLHAVPPHL